MLFSARTAKQSSTVSKDLVAVQSLNTTQKSKQTDKKSGKTASQTNTKSVDSASSEQNAKKPKYSNNIEATDNQSDKNGDKSLKKAKHTYVDAVEKLENSSSIHVPKKLVLFVGNLPDDITKEQLMAHFKRAGIVFIYIYLQNNIYYIFLRNLNFYLILLESCVISLCHQYRALPALLLQYCWFTSFRFS